MQTISENIFVSEMVGKDGKITMDWLNGRRRNNNSAYHIHDIHKPPEAAWAVWKQFIFKNFITGNREISPPMQLTTTNRPQRERSNGNDPQLLERRLELLSPQYQQILGEHNIDNQAELLLRESILQGSLICGSDASLQESNGYNKGTHAYSIQDYNSNRGNIQGRSFTPMSTNLTSLTAESYGVIAILIILRELCIDIEEQRIQNKTITILTDNKEVIQRCKNPPEVINASQTMAPDYDLWKLTQDLIQQIKVKLLFMWIKGHQDELKSGQKLYGLYLRPTQINIDMDREAGLQMKHHNLPLHSKYKRPLYPHMTIGFYSEEGMQIGHLKSYLLQTINGKKMKHLYSGRRTRLCWILRY